MVAPARQALDHARQRARRGGRVRPVDQDPGRAREQLGASRQPRGGEPFAARRPRARRREFPRAARRPARAPRWPPDGRPVRGAAPRARAVRRAARAAARGRPRPGPRRGSPRPARRAARSSSRARAATTFRAGSGSAPATAGTPGLRMPAFSRRDRGERVAELVGVLELDGGDAGDRGRHRVGRVQPAAEADLEHRRGPPAPPGTARARRRWWRRRRSAPGRGPRARSASTSGAAVRTAAARSGPATSSPSIRKRSVQRSRCGEVKVPTRSPAARSSDSAKSAVEPLPLEPAMWITERSRCGSPSRASSAADRLEREPRVRKRRGASRRRAGPSSQAAAAAASSIRAGARRVTEPCSASTGGIP